MATITNRNGSYRAEIRLSGHPRKSQCFATKRAASRWSARVEREMKTGIKRAESGKALTLGHAIDAYVGSTTGQNLTSHELSVLVWWRKQLGKKPLKELSRANFYETRDRIKGKQGQPLAYATLNKRMAIIAAVLTRAFDREWIQTYPARIPRLTERNQRERLVSEDERIRLLQACENSREPSLFPLVVCAMLSGARAGELVSLRWESVDLEKGIARLSKTKTGQRRPIPLRGRAKEVLMKLAGNAMREGRETIRGLVFRHANGSTPFKYRRSWEKARAEADAVDLHFHDLRHLAASELAMSGVSSRELQALLGHSSAQMTSRYSHFIEDHTLELGDRLNDRLFGNA